MSDITFTCNMKAEIEAHLYTLCVYLVRNPQPKKLTWTLGHI